MQYGIKSLLQTKHKEKLKLKVLLPSSEDEDKQYIGGIKTFVPVFRIIHYILRL